MVGQEALHQYQQKHLLEAAAEVQDKPQWEPHQEVLVEAVQALVAMKTAQQELLILVVEEAAEAVLLTIELVVLVVQVS